MRNIKQAIFALILINVTLIFSGCPGINAVSAESYTIALDGDTENCIIEVSRSAIAGDIVTIKVVPNSGFEAVDVKVRDSLNHNERVFPGPNNTWIFTMPASNVIIAAIILTTGETLQRAADRLSRNSTWEEINDVNALIKKIQGAVIREPDSVILESAIEKLAGAYNNPGNPGQGRQNGRYDEKVGLVLEKMRNEDMTKWVTGRLALSPVNNNVWDTRDCSSSGSGIMRNVTKVYYVESQINGVRPGVTEQGGWEIEEIKPCNIFGNVNLWHVKLLYKVGTGVNDAVRYNLLLCRTAQYNVTYNSTAIGDIFIIAYDPSQERIIKYNAINETLESEWVCDAGAAGDEPNSLNMYTVIYTRSSNIVITVRTADANALIVNAHLPVSALGPPPFVPPSLWESEKKKFENLPGAKFFPASAEYDVIVSRTPLP